MEDKDVVIPSTDELVKQLMPRLGESLAPVITEGIRSELKELGIDRTDRKQGLFPGIEGGEDPKKSPEQRAALFLRAVLFGRNVEDAAVGKALSEGTDSAGGYLVPEEFRGEIIRWAPELSELYRSARVIPVVSDSGKMPKAASGISMSWDEGENADFDESDPTFGQITWTAHRMNAITKTSRELVNDSNPKIVKVITDLFSEAVAEERDKMIAIGSGSSQPKGIYSETGIDSVAVGGSITYAKLVEIKYTLKRRYLRGARWVMNTTNLRRISALTDDNGQPLISNALLVDGVPTILGKAYGVQDDIPDHTIFFGDLSKYYWFDREVMGIEATTSGGDAFRKHQLWIKVWERCDGKLALNGSGRLGAFVKGTGVTA